MPHYEIVILRPFFISKINTLRYHTTAQFGANLAPNLLLNSVRPYGGFMKNLMMLTLICLISAQAFAWKATPEHVREFTFKYSLSGESLEVKRKAASYEEAFETAAQDCFKHFKGTSYLTEDRGLDIIDTCANPRS